MKIRVDVPTKDAPANVAAAFSELGIELDKKSSAALRGLVTGQRDVVDWLAESDDARDRFRADPVGALTEKFPERHLAQSAEVPPVLVADTIFFDLPVGGPAIDVFRELAAYVFASPANLARFETDPFTVFDERTAGMTPGPVAQVRTALLDALGILSPDLQLAGVQDLAFRRP